MSEKIKAVVNHSLAIAQDIGLIIVAIATLVAVGIEINFMFENGTVLLTDLLLLFIYLEVLTMVAVYYKSGELPIKFPLYIAIVALARYLILDMKNIDTWRILGVTVAILLLGLSIIVIHYCQTNLFEKSRESVD
ncbi:MULTISPECIES: phosphate-starvation-inducible PsiE family protein [unclassified Methylophaga]|jgi:protein PsiE|uniref:phosphate-starvation-inducible PsiE family protein n=1 Tax=unclassified Methylophaga TaxID=2629249 RepID=UPI000C971036|nr:MULTISPECIES: phosphate-starvation-inducible PsiE family protein [unclassified Methylophaga]MAK66359.1 protein PsiE [Methylophaga sp.]MAY17053.1 protein PsiE [Methylophaga sp.]MBN46158.1 protein PsiE [Methylophaga sp.]HAO24795.1 protein PsiE [Methylophaga sp.]|tara:strand:- start:40640 stop:41044 length:405 start_codon:yes stop_codon:yes gene_type:complete